MKYCFLSPGLRSVDVLKGDTRLSGGAESQVAYLAAALASLNHEVDLIYGYGRSNSIPCIHSGVHCIDAFPTWNHPLSLIRFWESLRESNSRLIYARLPSDFLWLAGLFVRQNTESSFVYAVGNDRSCNPWDIYRPCRGRWLHSLLFAMGLRMANFISIQHEGQAQMVKPYVNGQLILIPNLVRSVQSNPRRYEETSIDAIWIAQIRPQKQLNVLLNIAEQLPKLQFFVVGGFAADTNRGELESRMRSLENLHFEGACQFNDVIRLLISSRVLINTSAWEGFPNTMLEAWSVGVPVVSLQIDPGGVIDREGLGLVSGTQAQMIRDIEKLVQNRSLNYEMGKRGQDYVRRTHSIETVCRAFDRMMPGF